MLSNLFNGYKIFKNTVYFTINENSKKLLHFSQFVRKMTKHDRNPLSIKTLLKVRCPEKTTPTTKKPRSYLRVLGNRQKGLNKT